MRFTSLLLALALAAPVVAALSDTRIPEAALATTTELREQALATPPPGGWWNR